MKSEGSSILKFEDVTFRRSSKEILKGVNWEILEGEQWALLGQNGSGKSTLLSMIPAYTHPSSGKVFVLGKEFGKFDWEKIRMKVGFVSSALNYFTNTLNKEIVRDVVLSGKYSSIGIYKKIYDEDIRKAGELIRDFKLEYIANSYFSTLSEGEKRRTLIARAFMSPYEIMILDEPCANLDIKSREYLLRTLDDIRKKENKPIIYVTHNIEEISTSTTHIALIQGGQILKAGPKDEILTDSLLSQVYEIDVRVHKENDRAYVIVK